MNLTLEEILNTSDVKVFFMERLVDALKADENKTITKLYQEYFQKREKEINIIEDRPITTVFTKFGIAKTVWPTLLKFSDEHIQANIDYCVTKYQKAKGQRDISGIIVTAIKNDYAHYEINTKEKELEAAKKQFDNDIAKGFQKAVESKKAELFSEVPDTNEKSEIEQIPIPQPPIHKAEAKTESRGIEEEFERVYKAFMSEASLEDKESIKEAAISYMRGIQASVLANMFGVKKEELHNIPVDKLLTSRIFEQAYKQTFRKEMGL